MTVASAPGSLRDRLTRAFVAYYYSSVEAIEEVSGPSGPGVVYWFAGSDALGQTTPFGTIILNRPAFDRLSPAARTYVLEHERGHQRRGRPFSVWYWTAFACWALVSAATLYTALVGLVGSPVAWPVSLPWAFLAANGLFLATWWVDELRADLAALGAVGERRFHAARAELDDGIRSRRMRVLQRVVYPSPAVTARLAALLARLRG